MSDEATQRQSSELYNNAAYLGFSALQMRLDCTPIYEKIENFLRGNTPSVELDNSNEARVVWLKTGSPKCNDKGVQSILSKIISIINAQVVQGNLKLGTYEDRIAEYRESFTDDILLNCYNWEICDDDLNFMIDFVMDEMELFLTRLVDNEERKSYAQTIKSAEQNVIQSKGGGLKFLG